jgi:hypothetical protein
MLARQRSSAHRYVQVTGVLFMLMATILALSSEAFDSVEGSRGRKRHLHPVVQGRAHTHATMHSLVGLMLMSTLVGQIVIGCGASSPTRGSTYPRLKRIHRAVGRIVVLLVVPMQIGSGVVAVFQLCSPELSGTDQCVGHNTVGAAMLLAAATYWYWGERPSSFSPTAHLCRYDTSFIEHGAALTGSLMVIMYSLYSEFPYTEHPNGAHHLAAGCVLALFSLVALLTTWKARAASVPMGHFVLRGVPIVVTAVVAGSSMFAHHQLNEYGRILHVLFGVTLYFVAVARIVRRFKTMSFFIVLAAFFFMASQRGFQVLYGRFYHNNFPIGAVAAVLALAASIVYFGATLCARRVRTAKKQTPTTPRRAEEAHVEEILNFGSAEGSDEKKTKKKKQQQQQKKTINHSRASEAVKIFLHENAE